MDPSEILSIEEKLHIRKRENDADEEEGATSPLPRSPINGSVSAETLALVKEGSLSPQSPGSSSSSSSSSSSNSRSSISPWKDPRCLTIGLVSFLNNITFCGMSVLLPLVLNRPQWGLTHDGLSATLSGFSFAFIGVVQAIAMMSLFLAVRRYLGLLRTCVLGSVLFGVDVMLISWPTENGPAFFLEMVWLPLFLAAAGNGLCRPAYTIYLTMIASKSRVGETLSLIDVTLNGAMVVGPQLTMVLQNYGMRAAFALAGGAALLQAFILLALILTERRGGGGRGPGHLEHAAIPKDQFVKEMQAFLLRILEERNYSLEKYSAQLIVREIIDQSFPYLRPGGPQNREHMRDVFMLMKALGYDELASDVQARFGFANHDEPHSPTGQPGGSTPPNPRGFARLSTTAL